MHKVKEKIAANVVTYNRKGLLGECIDALLNQTYPLDAIYIIDNASTDGTPEFLMQRGLIDEQVTSTKEPIEAIKLIPLTASSDRSVEIHYVRMPENIGSSGGQYEGVKRGYDAGFDWIWVMDDDAEPENGALASLAEYFCEEDVSCLACVVEDRIGNIQMHHRGMINFKNLLPLPQKDLNVSLYKEKKIIEVDMVSFVGILLKAEAVKLIGYPNRYFFIHNDDVEYSIRLKKAGKLLLITKSIIIHKEQANKELIIRRFFHKKIYIHPYDKLWIRYYGERNLIWLCKKYSESKLNFYINLLKRYTFTQLCILLFEDKKINRTLFYISSILDGLMGVFDNDKPKNILYKHKLTSRP